MFASEVSEAARKRAQGNASKILGKGAERLHVLTPRNGADVWWSFEGLEPADFLISNPPYLTRKDEIAADVRAHEPTEALYAPDDDAVFFYREISNQGAALMKPGAWVFLEIPHERAQEIERLFSVNSWYTEIQKDLTGRERVLIARTEPFKD
jgi:methylase of polypeptide subunit release factors